MSDDEKRVGDVLVTKRWDLTQTKEIETHWRIYRFVETDCGTAPAVDMVAIYEQPGTWVFVPQGEPVKTWDRAEALAKSSPAVDIERGGT